MLHEFDLAQLKHKITKTKIIWNIFFMLKETRILILEFKE